MKDNKLYKVLRIVFLTLAIISLIFSLSKKFVHAASSGGTPVFVPVELPLPFGAGSRMGYGTYPLTQDIVDGSISFAYSTYGYSFSCVSVYEVATDNSYIILRICNDPSRSFYLNNVSYPDITSNSTWGSSTSYGSCLIKYDGSYSLYRGYNYEGWGNISFYNWRSQLPSGGYGILKDVALYNYPVYCIDGDIIANGNTIFYVDSSGGSSDESILGQGSIIGTVTDYDGNGFDYDLDISIDLNPLTVLGEEIRDGLSDFKDRVVEGFQVIGGKIDTFKDRVVEGFQTLTSIPSKVSDIYDYITESFDENKFSEKFSEMELGQEISTFRTDIESFTGTFDVAPAVADDVKFTIPFTLPYVNQNLQAVIDFSFYDRIRSIIVPFFTVFLIFGMVWSLIRSIPGILHGTSPDGDS